MKNFLHSKIIIFSLLCCVFLTTACTTSKPIGMPNPWTDCGENSACANKVAGFGFPVDFSNMQITAMKDIIQVVYPLDETREVTVRKATEELYNSTDISGDYNNYPIKDTLTLDNGVKFEVRRDENLIYVAYFGAESGYYSINCPKGITKAELEQIYSAIAKVESAHF